MERGRTNTSLRIYESGQEKECTVEGLSYDTEYSFCVQGGMGASWGGWSDAINIRTKRLLGDSKMISDDKVKGATFANKLCLWCGTDKFELLYRGTRDGFGAYDFHRLCDNKGKTLVLIKNTSGHVFGGFASVPWSSPFLFSSYKQAPGSFLFTLTNMYGIQPIKFPLKNENDGSAVEHDGRYGPTFGSGRDIIIYSNCDTNANSHSDFSSYKDTTGKGHSIFSSNPKSDHFQVQEIEVLKVCV